ALDVLLVLFLQHKGFRLLEALVVALIVTIAGCFLFEIAIARPELGPVLGGFVPHFSVVRDPAKLYIAIGILGATVMPHNLYLHSSIVQTRRYEESAAGKRMAVRYAVADSTVALSLALFINAAILIVAAATFHRAGRAHGYLLRGERHRATPHSQSGDPQPAALLRRIPAGAVHVRPGQDGGVREPGVAQDARLWRGGRDRRPQRSGDGAGVRRLAAVMYRRILVPLEHSPADETILAHVRVLARGMGSALVLVHVADGWVARNIRELDLRGSEAMG